MFFKRILQILGLLAVVAALVPIISLNIWWIRMFDYPLIQFTLLTFVMVVLYIVLFDKRVILDYIVLTILLGCFVFQFLKLFPYTFLVQKRVKDSSAGAETTLKIFEANVLQKNGNYQLLLEQVKKENADILLFTETNQAWQQAISQGIDTSYRYKVEVPQDNTYGMLLYSKLKLVNSAVRFRVRGDIPSINTDIILPDGTRAALYAMHPTPPDPQHKPSSSDRGSEMKKTALALMDVDLPTMVLGDFNEVAWSQNISLFQKISDLSDVRAGRGFYNTFDADSYIMRWPLDQMFVSEHFRLKDLHVGDYKGSDHFPLVITLTYEPEKAVGQNQNH